MEVKEQKHPAPYSDAVLDKIQQVLDHHLWRGGLILDPMAGAGRIHDLLRHETYGVELEPEWAQMSLYTVVGDATKLPHRDRTFDAIVVSPCYGNRMSDHHNAQDGSYRRTYKHVLGRDLRANNAGAMPWGDTYRQLHRDAWAEAVRVLKPRGYFLLNCKDHYKNGARVHVTNWHFKTLQALGLNLVEVSRIPTPHYRFGANRELRHTERLLVFYKAAA